MQFFLREYYIEKELERWASRAKNPNKTSRVHGVMKKYLRRLRRQETREQMRASVSKLKKLIEDGKVKFDLIRIKA